MSDHSLTPFPRKIQFYIVQFDTKWKGLQCFSLKSAKNSIKLEYQFNTKYIITKCTSLFTKEFLNLWFLATGPQWISFEWWLKNINLFLCIYRKYMVDVGMEKVYPVSLASFSEPRFTFAANRINLLPSDIHHVFDLSCFLSCF
jgi:hypothetical protein